MILIHHLLPLLVPIGVVVSLAHWLFCRFFWRHAIPATIPWAGSHDGKPLSRARAVIRSLFDTRGLLVDSYAKYSQNGLPYVLPNLIQGPEVILPQTMVDWLLQQPDSVLDQNEVNRDFLQADFTMLHPKVATDTVHGEVIKKVLTRRLGEFTGDVLEEVDFAFRSAWGVDTDNWKTITAYDTMSEVITRISNRVLVGLPLCRNEDYLYYSSRFARFVILESAAIHMFPNFLRPFVAPIVTLFDYRRYLRMAKHIIPIWKRRTSAPMQDDKQKSDYVQWCLDFADDRRDPEERSSDMISKRLAALTFAAIQSSVITSTNLLFDLAASDQTPDLFNLIRKEVDLELEFENGAWNKNSLARMVTLDSALRESMRLGGFVSRGILKTVAAKDGIKLPGPNGAHLPYGTKVGVHAYPVHYDEEIYPRAKEFDPLRFCLPTPEENIDEKTSKSGVRGIPLVNTSPIFMGFSHGRHACPGRFFATQQLKLVLAYVALNYEIFPIPVRPQNKWLIGSSGPPLDATITIRRRKGTVA
ncbi:hypothetical protein HYFRA_00006408 [Hymenoscyphus fraxineus]|uniref:Cytochrome P450 n=1 Tax=Hymenoscyphus fraxineus TaxID=746836 RepID=A0A9N9KPL0_9HELO|nr:hypothetical protein HYFRA_00006408 [Hymenoscyphus fraxineus]